MQYLLPLLALLTAPQTVHQWAFDTPQDLAAWKPNSFLTDVAIADGALHARATDWDPFLTCYGLEIPTSPCQVVVIRMRATKAGQGDLFWAGDPSLPNGGMSEQRKGRFQVPGDGAWHDIPVFPFWHSAGTIRALRLDVYDDATFDIDSITIQDWSAGKSPISLATWDATGLSTWYDAPDGRSTWSPIVDGTGPGPDWASLTMTAATEGVGALLWGTKGRPGVHRQEFTVLPGERTYNLEMIGVPGWENVVAVGVQRPPGAVTLSRLSFADAPAGPADVRLIYFGVEDGVNRVGHPARVTAQFTNRGGAAVPSVKGVLDVPAGITVVPETTMAENLDFERRGVLSWTLQGDTPGDYPMHLSLTGEGVSLEADATLSLTKSPDVPVADYVPAPKPVETNVDIAAYYFPGWDSPAKWDPVQRVAPVRKPVLGWYDEANPEIVDWQIKWAVENGISVFLLDWYWVKGSQHLQHWWEAYKKSRYRDQLKVALMWANHNPPGTHSAEDWKRVSDHWIAEYFTQDSYYHMNGKPAVFLWDHRNIRKDLGGSEAVAKAFAASQEAARAAGFEGIHYVGLHPWGDEKIMEQEGYHGVTRYHEWGNAEGLAADPKRMQFADVVATARASWERQRESQGGMTFYPVVDTGWDARPWHGNRARVISGRTPALFKELLQEANDFVEETDVPLVILGPMNEWGEGSYIEPNTEFGFDMMNAIRDVFGQGDPASWPTNVAPVDVGLGPYDFPEPAAQFRWTFDRGAEGWRTMMGLGDMTVGGGQLTATTATRDPAFVLPLPGIAANTVAGFRIRMQVTGDLPEVLRAQMFWSRGGESTSEAASVAFDLATDGAMHDYTVSLEANPRWRGEITLLRLDPCSVMDATVRLEEFTLLPHVTPEEKALARRILDDERLDQVLDRAKGLLATGLTAGAGYGEVWIRDLNSFIELAADVVPHDELRTALLRFFHFQGADGNIVDGYIPKEQAGVSYDFITSETMPDFLAHKNTVETDQESSLIQAVCRYARVTGDRALFEETINGKTVAERLVMVVDFLRQHRLAEEYGLLWGGTTADWGDVQPEHEWGVVLDESSHRAIDIYDNALCIAALNDLLEAGVLQPAAAHALRTFRDQLKVNVRKHLWDEEREQFRPHVYLEGSPFPDDFNEAEIYYHGGTSVAMEAGLLSREEVGEAYQRMVKNVEAAGAASIGLTMYPAYPEGLFKNPILTKPYTYQNGGDWTWFGGRTLSQLIEHGYVKEAYDAMGPMVDRVLKNDGFYEWYTVDNKPSGSGQYRGAAGVLGKAIRQLRDWAGRHTALKK